MEHNASGDGRFAMRQTAGRVACPVAERMGVAILGVSGPDIEAVTS
jgi:hypothetical protein